MSTFTITLDDALAKLLEGIANEGNQSPELLASTLVGNFLKERLNNELVAIIAKKSPAEIIAIAKEIGF